MVKMATFSKPQEDGQIRYVVIEPPPFRMHLVDARPPPPDGGRVRGLVHLTPIQSAKRYGLPQPLTSLCQILPQETTGNKRQITAEIRRNLALALAPGLVV
jgi:hypothetical protein